MGAVRFEGVDILDALGQIMELHTQHFKQDFDLDKELIPKLAVSADPEDRRLLWMSRPCGTYTLRERETYLDGSYENSVWKYYHEQSKDPVLAYALSIKGIQDGKVMGNIYPLDYPAHVERVKLLTCPIEKVTVTFEDGAVVTLPYQTRRQFINELSPEHGTPKFMRYEPESEQELAMILKRERFKRSYQVKPGNIKEYIDGLKKSTVRGQLKSGREVKAPHRNHQHKGGPER
ncbi:TPA: hypothetical protein KN012_001124 [Clostridioides difficile]|nr:hypothetical protein [Clostridioides difficile]HBF4648252.1 hypothetical protein [Clostridioides difficile]